MARKRLLTDEQIVDLYLSGIDSYTVGLRANCDATEVLKKVRAAGHQVRKRGGRPLLSLSIPIEQAVKLYQQDGLSVQDVADRAGVNRATMAKALRRAGIPIRTLQDVADLKRITRR